jgi:hypothetical protein
MTENTPAVVNVRAFGGVRPAEAAGVVYVGRPTPLGNPFTHLSVRGLIRVATREEAVARYRERLWRHIRAGDAEVLAALRRIKPGDRLGCWCWPLACHASVVAAAWSWMKREGLL